MFDADRKKKPTREVRMNEPAIRTDRYQLIFAVES